MLVRINTLLSVDPREVRAIEGDTLNRSARLEMHSGKMYMLTLEHDDPPAAVEQLVEEITDSVNRALAIPPGLETVVLNVGAR